MAFRLHYRRSQPLDIVTSHTSVDERATETQDTSLLHFPELAEFTTQTHTPASTQIETANTFVTQRGISIILPAWNEEEIIAETIANVMAALATMTPDFEIIIVDDGSIDQTGTIVDDLAAHYSCIKPIHNNPNQGYGGALATGFLAAQKELTFFMDADGQFDISDLRSLILPLELGQGTVAVGYRAHRQDPPLRLLNAWSWKQLVSFLFQFRVRDIDCAFKLMPTAIVRTADIQARGAMINTEMFAKFTRMGITIAQVPVQHLPRQKGKATGADIKVILRAFGELFTLFAYVRAWKPAVEIALTPAVATQTSDTAVHETDFKQKDFAAQKHEGNIISDAEPPVLMMMPTIVPLNNLGRFKQWLRVIDIVPTATAPESLTRAGEPLYEQVARWLDDSATRRDQKITAESDASITFSETPADKQLNSVFSTLPAHDSAEQTITSGQVGVLIAMALVWIAGIWLLGMPILVGTIGVITVLYLGDLLVTAFLAQHTMHSSPERRIDDSFIHALAQYEWPDYTILCPLYKEAEIVPQFVHAMQAMDYPHESLRVLFLTEEDDQATRDAIAAMNLPDYFEIVTVPDGQPRTKPRACNYGLMMTDSEFVVIYDAEDIPDPLQLKKAVLTFALETDDVACVQAKLNFYNPDQNLLTRWFTTEYTLWFDLTLPGLQWAHGALPLGGTSNHFRTSILRNVGAWDPYNVTEDCDLGLRLAKHELRTVMLDSTTMEEANSDTKNWIRQRSRWIKGYMQTYLVHMRHPSRYITDHRLWDFASLQIVVGARSLMLFVNPLMWVLLAVYVGFRPLVASVFHVIYPAPIFYIGVCCFVFGNFLYIYTYLIACARRRQYGLMLFALCVPGYWAMMSIAAMVALFQLIYVPHYWEKTQHGLHLQSAANQQLNIDTANLRQHITVAVEQFAQSSIQAGNFIKSTTHSDRHALPVTSQHDH